MKIALFLIALLPTLAHGVNKCDIGGKTTYTDTPCEKLGGRTAKSFTPQPNVVESQETRSPKPHEINRDVVDDLNQKRTVPPQSVQPPPAPSRSTNRETCKQIDNALAMNASAARQPNSAATLDYLAAQRRKLHDQRSQLECEKLEPVT